MSDLASMPPMPRSSAAPFRRRPLFAAAQGTLKAKVDVNLNAVCKLARFYSYHEGRTLGSVPCLMPGGRSTCCQELKVWDRRKEPFFAAAHGTLKAKVEVNLNAVCKLTRFLFLPRGENFGVRAVFDARREEHLLPGAQRIEGLKVWDRRKEGERADLSKHFFSCREVCKRQKKRQNLNK